MSETGKVTRVWSKPTRGFALTVPPKLEPPPPEPGYELIFVGVDADDWALAVAAFSLKCDATVTGTAPNSTGVSLP